MREFGQYQMKLNVATSVLHNKICHGEVFTHSITSVNARTNCSRFHMMAGKTYMNKKEIKPILIECVDNETGEIKQIDIVQLRHDLDLVMYDLGLKEELSEVLV